MNAETASDEAHDAWEAGCDPILRQAQGEVDGLPEGSLAATPIPKAALWQKNTKQRAETGAAPVSI
jgi:hypothetical protein